MKENNQKVNSNKKPNIKAKEHKIRESWDSVFKKEKGMYKTKHKLVNKKYWKE